MKKVQVENQKPKGCGKYLLWGVLIFVVLNLIPMLGNKGKYLSLPILIGIIYVLYRYVIKPIFFDFGYKKIYKGDIQNNSNSSSSEMVINRTTTIENPFAGIFISGGAGSGKSKSLIEPLIKEAGAKNFTGVIYDFKFPELAQYVNSAYSNSQVKQYYFNFQDLNRSHKINPIAPNLMKNESFAREFAHSIIANLNPSEASKPNFFVQSSISFLTAVFWYLKEKYPSYCTLPHAIAMLVQPRLDVLLYELQSVPKAGDIIAPIMTAFESGANDQLSGVVATLQDQINKINLREVYYLMSESNINLELNNTDEKGILVLGNDPILSTTYAPIMGLILTSISKQLNRQDKEKSVFMVDEFPTVYIPNVEQLPATARSNKVATILACQDISQITDKYGREKADTILSNLGNQFYGRTPNPQTAKRVSEIFGKAEKEVISYSKSPISLNKGRTHSTRETDIVKVQDVAQLPTGSFYTILAEGKQKQGLSEIPMDSNFVKTPIQIISNVSESDLENAYNRVRNEVNNVILKEVRDFLDLQKKG